MKIAVKDLNTRDFNTLVQSISDIQDILQAQTAHAINLSLTVRNWLIGYYIVEYEQHGEDRAQYGEKLLNRLSEKLGRKGLDARRLREFRQVYLAYPQLAEEVDKYLKNNVNPTLTTNNSKWRMLSAIFEGEVGGVQIWRMPSAKLESWQTPAEKLFQRLSASHLIMLSGISDTLKRAFYEQEAIKGCWTVKELDRQISSLCYERMGYSKNKAALQKHLADKNNPITAADIIRNPLSLEFLGLQQQDVFTETKLETAILNHLQQFLLELGTGFCFEARQKRVLIDNDYFKADLVFYHRILKCHVIVDLKIDRFRHEYASQLNLYLNYFKHEIMQTGDNPPVGLLLCTDYGETTVKYATEGLSQNLFVSKYKLQLPSEEEIKKFLTDNFAQIESL